MAIPFKTLRFREAEEQKWGVNFLRRNERRTRSGEVIEHALIAKFTYAFNF
jgi:hypothetical protein